ncbi:MAG TPA: homoserine kinase [Polyangiaceae bacterium]|nr:homoserine kinase [Polyangiaceae bacterium]
MALLTELTRAEASQALARYGMQLLKLIPLEQGSVNSNFRIETDRGLFFARIYEEQPLSGALAEMQLIRKLQQLGVPTPAPLEPTDPAPVLASGKPFAVYPWVEGEILCYGRVTAAHLIELGKALATLHLASAALGVLPKGRFGPEGLQERLGSIEQRLNPADRELSEAVTQIRAALTRYTQRRSSSVPQGIIHGDLFRDNALWAGTTLGAVIDFESASHGAFTYDLMVCAHAWCFGDRFDLGRVRALFEGYLQQRKLEPEEYEALVVEGAIGALRFATTRISDFSLRAAPGTSPKRDSRRFWQRLAQLESGALSPLFADLQAQFA